MKTRLSICRKKIRYRTQAEAIAVALAADFPLRPYRCDRCRLFHLTGRTKGKMAPRLPVDPSLGPAPTGAAASGPPSSDA